MFDLKAKAAIMLATLVLAVPAASGEVRPALQREAAEKVDAQAKLVQEMVDSVFSLVEPGFQEYRTMAYLTAILDRNGFTVTRGVAGIPTAWTATWEDGGPLIALGSDGDCPTGLSQYPGVPTLKPMVEGAPKRPGLVSVEYTFKGKTAHAGGMPWEGRSALDGIEIMSVAWNFRREHLPLT